MNDDDLYAELVENAVPFELTEEYLVDFLVPREIATKRLIVCYSCEFFVTSVSQCSVNGWLVPEAAGGIKLDCPKGKWAKLKGAKRG